MSIVFNITCIAAGVLLGIETLDKWDGAKDFFKKIENFLSPYNIIIGGILLTLSILGLIGTGCLIYNVLGAIAGLLLLINILSKTPIIGEFLLKISKALLPFKALIGVATLIVGVTNLIGIHLLC